MPRRLLSKTSRNFAAVSALTTIPKLTENLIKAAARMPETPVTRAELKRGLCEAFHSWSRALPPVRKRPKRRKPNLVHLYIATSFKIIES
jgi:hypothetical protein